MPAMLRADVQINAEISLRTEISGYDADFLKNVIRQLDRYARSAKLRNSRQQLNIICGTSDSFRIAGKYLYIPGDAGLWQENFALRRKIYGVLAAHRFNFRYPPGSAGVAPWIANALDSELLAAETSGQYFVSNRSFPLLTGFAANCGRLPNFEAMAKLQYPCRDKVLQDIAGEQGRILLHILADAGKTGELFSRSCAGGDPAEFITYFSSPQQAEEILNQAAGRFLWNRMHPMPARAALKQLPQLEKTMVPLVDENMTATGEFKEYSWQDFAILMENQPDRQDRNQLIGAVSCSDTIYGHIVIGSKGFDGRSSQWIRIAVKINFLNAISDFCFQHQGKIKIGFIGIQAHSIAARDGVIGLECSQFFG